MILMRKTILSIILLGGLQLSAGQTHFTTGSDKPFVPKINTIYYKLGDRIIRIKTFQYGNAKDLVFINLHDDEITAVNGARKVLEQRGGFLIKIENYRTRNIKFKLEGKQYTIDPNRMFSRPGIARSLLIFGNTSPKAIEEVEKFANRVLQIIPANRSWIIALHNNSNGRYSINSYRRGGDKEMDARELKVNNDLDADDFFLTTDSILFQHLSNENYNTIWQDNLNAKKDGSLSIYCGERNIHYVNCETEHGRQPEYDQMIFLAVNRATGKNLELVPTVRQPDTRKTELITAVSKPPSKTPEANSPRRKSEKKSTGTASNLMAGTALNIPNPDVITYNYRINPSGNLVPLASNTEILFGERKVGWLRSVLVDSSMGITGKLEMNKGFALYSNMDFFVFISSSAAPRLELRIDPTRKKVLINPQFTTIPVSIKVIN